MADREIPPYFRDRKIEVYDGWGGQLQSWTRHRLVGSSEIRHIPLSLLAFNAAKQSYERRVAEPVSLTYLCQPNTPSLVMRRNLKFACLDESIKECEQLLETGYTRSGNWSLAQICCHLRYTIERNMHGYPMWMTMLGYPLRPILRRLLLPHLLAGDSPKGIRTAGIFVPPNKCVDDQEVDQFTRCVAEFKKMNKSMYAHPGFGRMTNEEFNRFHAAHAAHHLSFLRPKEKFG